MCSLKWAKKSMPAALNSGLVIHSLDIDSELVQHGQIVED